MNIFQTGIVWCITVCHTKAQHMISLTTRPLAWGGTVWAHAYNDVLSSQTLPPHPDTERDWCCRMIWGWLGRHIFSRALGAWVIPTSGPLLV